MDNILYISGDGLFDSTQNIIYHKHFSIHSTKNYFIKIISHYSNTMDKSKEFGSASSEHSLHSCGRFYNALKLPYL